MYEEQRQIDQTRRWYSGLAMILAQVVALLSRTRALRYLPYLPPEVF